MESSAGFYFSLILAEEEGILNSVPRADGAHYLSAANTMKARLQEGTGERIFESLDEWPRYWHNCREQEHVVSRFVSLSERQERGSRRSHPSSRNASRSSVYSAHHSSSRVA